MVEFFELIVLVILIWAFSYFLVAWLGILKGVYHMAYFDYISREISSKNENSQKN